jgi:hypothetical protein
MFNKKEVAWIIIAIIILGFIIGFQVESTDAAILNEKAFLIALIIILVPVLTKKTIAGHYNIKITHTILSLKRYGFYIRSKLKKPLPIGLIIPFFIGFVTLGLIKIMTILQFDVENIPKKRALKKTGTHRYSQINDSDIAFTSAWGFWSLIVLTIIASLINQPELAKYSIYYGIWNLLPISNLDGTKLFFGSLINWIILAIVYIVSLIIVLI